MSASTLWDLYSFEKHWEDAAKTFLEAEVGIDCFVQASAENFVTPRLEIQFITGEATFPDDAPISSVPTLPEGEYRKHDASFEVRVVTDDALGQTRAKHFEYLGKVRATLLRSADNWNTTTLPYYGMKLIRQMGTSREVDGDLQITSVTWSIKFSIRSDAFPA